MVSTKQAFANVPHPGADRITDPNCCDDHTAWIEWCSTRTSQEFLAAIRAGGFHPCEFLSLCPEAYHYFSGSVIIYCLERLTQNFEDLSWSDWLDALYPLRTNARLFIDEYVVCFDHIQRSIVAQLLSLAAQRYFEQEEQHHEDFEWAAKEVWRSA